MKEITIKEYFGESIGKEVLKDDKSKRGGKSHADETLLEFIESIGMSLDDTIENLDKAMKKCGVKL